MLKNTLITILSLYKKIVKVLPKNIQKKLPQNVAIVRIEEEESRMLNQRYRGKNVSTNVLSFRYGDDYGEILVCVSVIRREAQAHKHSYRYQLAWMITHGVLHLARMHHEESETTRRRVEKLENNILKRLISA